MLGLENSAFKPPILQKTFKNSQIAVNKTLPKNQIAGQEGSV